MKKFLIVNILLLGSIITIAQQGEKLRVAVFDPSSSSVAIDGGTKEAVRELISSTFVNTGKYIMVERAALQQVIKEQKMSNTDEFDESQATELGRLANANKVILSVVSMVGGRNMLSIKVIDVKTATVELQKTKLVSSNDLLDAVEPLTLELLGEKPSAVTTVTQSQPKKEDKKPEKNTPAAPVQNDNSETIFACGLEIQRYDLYTEKVKYEEVSIPSGWRLPTRDELKCMCKEKKKIGHFKTNSFSNYFTGEFNRRGNKIYIRSFDDCKESDEDVDREKGWVRLVRNK